MRRAAVSVASNIAEGATRRSRVEYLQFLYIARASLAELSTQADIAVDAMLLESASQIPEDIAEVARLIDAVISALQTKHQ
jgi:four helix bundle protein